RVQTTVGRVLFNDALDERLPFYDMTISGERLAHIVSACHRILGQRETVRLLGRMKQLAFRELTQSGLSFAMDDLKTPASKEGVLKAVSQELDRCQRHYVAGNITEMERYSNAIALWTKARD